VGHAGRRPGGAIGVGEINPYEAPWADLDATGIEGLGEAREWEETWLWRDGPLLVIRKGAEFPDRCVRCGAGAGGYRLKGTLLRHSPGYFLLLLLGFIPYVIALSLCGRMASIRVGLCRDHRFRLWAAVVGGGMMVVAGMAGIAFTIDSDRLWPVVPVGCVLIFMGCLYAVTGTWVVRSRKITRQFAWMTIHPSVLEGLPDWPSTEAA